MAASEKYTKGHAPASPNIAAAFVGTIVYVWVECILRLIFTYYPDVPNSYSLFGYAQRDGDIAAMWLTMTGLGLIAYLVARRLLAGRASVGVIRTWTWILVVSAIAGPLIGEIGTPLGR